MYQQTALNTRPRSQSPAIHNMEAPTEEKRFCSNESCLTDEVNVRRVSSFKDVWLLTDTSDGTSWLMNIENPVCPCCGSKLMPSNPPRRLLC
ncbi:MAG: hypothetical protein U0350_15535 [Caldilineaceae bacterium]